MNIINPGDNKQSLSHASSWVDPFRTQSTNLIATVSSSVLGTKLSEFDITIKPQKIGNKVVVDFIVFYEFDYNGGIGFLITRNDVLLAEASNGTVSTRDAWGITDVPNFDGTSSSTPQRKFLSFTDATSLDVASTYSLWATTTDGAVNKTCFINRSVGGPGSLNFENGVSETRITEYIT